jgi:hypothetical protein
VSTWPLVPYATWPTVVFFKNLLFFTQFFFL